MLHIKPVLTMAYYEPMRKDEIIRLTWKEIDIKAGFIRLAAPRTKGSIEGRSIPIHPAVSKMLSSLPRSFQSNRVFLRRVNGQYVQFNDFRMEIAQDLDIHKSTVSRFVQRGKEEGVIKPCSS